MMLGVKLMLGVTYFLSTAEVVHMPVQATVRACS